MQIHRAAADMILAYYRVKDSDPESINYLEQLETVTRVCLNKFDSLDESRHPLVDLFVVLHSQEKDLLRLDLIGAEELAEMIHDTSARIDATLRAAVSKVTGVDVVISNIQVDESFLDQFNIENPNTLWFEFYKTDRKK